MRPTAIDDYIGKNHLTIVDEVYRPWGSFHIYEQGTNYDKKVVELKPGQFLSMQYHGSPSHDSHIETYTAITDFVLAYRPGSVIGLSLEEVTNLALECQGILIRAGETFSIKEGELHAWCNPFNTCVYLLEHRQSSKTETWEDRESNITRIFDQTMRDGCPQWPQVLKDKIQALK